MSAKVPVSLEELVPLIYQGPLEEKPWTSLLRLLRQRLDCDVAAISLRIRSPGVTPITVWDRRVPLRPEEFEQASRSIAPYGHLDPLVMALKHPGDILTLDEVMPREELLRSDYYSHVVVPFGLAYQLGMHFAEPGGWRSNIGLMNGPQGRNFGPEIKALFASFRSHLERALELFARIRRSEAEKRIFEETLDRLAIGTFVLDGQGRVLDMNQVARRIAERNPGALSIKGRLSLVRPQAHERLLRAVKGALAWRERDESDCFVDAWSIAGEAGANLSILVRAVPAADPYRSDVTPSVIVYVCDPAYQRTPERFLAQLFGLSASEGELAALLAQGLTLAQAAERLDLTESTARSYSKRMFGKAGVSRQADLVRLILTSVAPLA